MFQVITVCGSTSKTGLELAWPCFPVYDWIHFEYMCVSSIKAWLAKFLLKGIHSIVSRFSCERLAQLSLNVSCNNDIQPLSTLSWSPSYIFINQQIESQAVKVTVSYGSPRRNYSTFITLTVYLSSLKFFKTRSWLLLKTSLSRREETSQYQLTEVYRL